MPHSYVGKKGHVSMLEISLALLNHMRRTEALYVSDRASMPRKISRLHCLGAKQSSFARGGTWKDVAEEGADMADGGNQMETRATTTFSPHLITWGIGLSDSIIFRPQNRGQLLSCLLRQQPQ